MPADETAAALRRLIRAREAPLVADEGDVVGCVAFHLIPKLQPGGPVGRITLLVVAKDVRRRGIGTELIAAAEARLAERGCTRVEAMSDIELSNAHAFFRRRGYERTSYRYAREIGGR